MNKEESIQQIQEAIRKMDQSIAELENIQYNLDEINKLEGNEEILAPLHNGIFVEAQLKNKNNVKVNIGDGVIVDKTLPEAKKLIGKQLKEIKNSKEKALEELNKVKNV